MNLKPTGKNVIVEPLDETKQSKSGLIIETKGESKPEQGSIFALGKDYSGFLQIGDKVIFKKYAPDEVDFEGKKYLIMKEEDILAVIRA